MSYQDLRDKTIIVTGAASGIGRATAIELARQGAQIGLLDLKQCDEVVREIVEAGGKAIAFVVDVADSAAVRHSMRQTAEHFGKISGAANLAGWVGSQRWSENGFSLHAIEDADWDAMIATNLTGVKNCVKAELENFHEDGGSIVNASSIAGQRGTKNNSPYGASKAAVIALSKAAAQETGSRQIRVNAIVPGGIATPMTMGLGTSEQLEDRLVSRTALKRLGTADEVARTVVFLLSASSSYITSTTVNADGGYQ